MQHTENHKQLLKSVDIPKPVSLNKNKNNVLCDNTNNFNNVYNNKKPTNKNYHNSKEISNKNIKENIKENSIKTLTT